MNIRLPDPLSKAQLGGKNPTSCRSGHRGILKLHLIIIAEKKYSFTCYHQPSRLFGMLVHIQTSTPQIECKMYILFAMPQVAPAKR